MQVFITLEIEESSSFAKYLGIFLKLVIILAIAGYVLSTLPALRVYPTVCDVPDCNDDPILCPGSDRITPFFFLFLPFYF